jgi:hypothetical protein
MFTPPTSAESKYQDPMFKTEAGLKDHSLPVISFDQNRQLAEKAASARTQQAATLLWL